MIIFFFQFLKPVWFFLLVDLSCWINGFFVIFTDLKDLIDLFLQRLNNKLNLREISWAL